MSSWINDLLLLGEDEEERMQRLQHEEALKRQQAQEQPEETAASARKQQQRQLSGAQAKREATDGEGETEDDDDHDGERWLQAQQEEAHAQARVRGEERKSKHDRAPKQEAGRARASAHHRSLAEDIEHELDELATGFMSFVGQARSFGSSLLHSAGDTIRAFDSTADQHNIEARLNPRPIRLLTVGIMGSGTYSHAELACPLAQWLARKGFNLLTGGGRGVMQAASKAFVSVRKRHGRSIGIVRSSDDNRTPFPGYPNPFVEIPILTHLSGKDNTPGSRNHINILTSDIIVCLPGSSGTASELALAVLYDKPVCVYAGPSHEPPAGSNTLDVPIFRRLQDVQEFVLGAANTVQRQQRDAMRRKEAEAVRKQRETLAMKERQRKQRQDDDLGAEREEEKQQQTQRPRKTTDQQQEGAPTQPCDAASSGQAKPAVKAQSSTNYHREGTPEHGALTAEHGSDRGSRATVPVASTSAATANASSASGCTPGIATESATPPAPSPGHTTAHVPLAASASSSQHGPDQEQEDQPGVGAGDELPGGADGGGGNATRENEVVPASTREERHHQQQRQQRPADADGGSDDDDDVVVVPRAHTLRRAGKGAKQRARAPPAIQLSPYATGGQEGAGSDEEPVLSPEDLQELQRAMTEEDDDGDDDA